MASKNIAFTVKVLTFEELGYYGEGSGQMNGDTFSFKLGKFDIDYINDSEYLITSQDSEKAIEMKPKDLMLILERNGEFSNRLTVYKSVF